MTSLEFSKPLVLDTNVVLDWLVFRNPAVVVPLEAALTDPRWRWYATGPMLAEIEHVLLYPEFTRWQVDRVKVVEACSQWAQLVATPVPPLSAALRCTDPDDQMFIDLALHLGGATLLSRDRAVLRLAGRALAHGVSILTPERWSP